MFPELQRISLRCPQVLSILRSEFFIQVVRFSGLDPMNISAGEKISTVEHDLPSPNAGQSDPLLLLLEHMRPQGEAGEK